MAKLQFGQEVGIILYGGDLRTCLFALAAG